MRVVYFGTAEFAVPALEAVASDVVLVVSQPDRPTGRGLSLRPSPVKEAALRLGLPVATPERCRAPEFIDEIRALEADVNLVAAYGQILPKALLEAAKRGSVNLHGSILPRYRGAAPIQRSIQAGDTFTGVSLMQMDEGMDTGDVIATELVSISPDDTAGDLTARLAEIAARLAQGWLPLISAGDTPRTPQDPELATHAPKVKKDEARLHPTMKAEEAYNRFRAFTPNPGAFAETTKGTLRVTRARLMPGVSPGLGVVAYVKHELVVGFAEGSINLLEVQPTGKRKMSGPAFANGARISVGDRLVV